jgi:hypothetical protein
MEHKTSEVSKYEHLKKQCNIFLPALISARFLRSLTPTEETSDHRVSLNTQYE